MVYSFLCFCPLRLAFMLNYNISKVAYHNKLTLYVGLEQQSYRNKINTLDNIPASGKRNKIEITCYVQWFTVWLCNQHFSSYRQVEVSLKRKKQSVFKWRYGGCIGVPKTSKNGDHVGIPNKSCGRWSLFLCKRFLSLQEICIDARHQSENTP